MPNGVRIAHAVVQHKKHHAQGVGDAAGQQPAQTRQGHALQHGHRGHHHQPAHGQIQARGRPRVGKAVKGLERHTGKRQSPDHAKQGPAPGSGQCAQSKRRVAARNKQINRAVVQLEQDALGPPRRQRVVERGSEVEQHHGGAKHGHAHDGRGVAVACGSNQKRHRGHGRQERHAVAHRIGDFFTQSLLAFSHGAIVRVRRGRRLTHLTGDKARACGSAILQAPLPRRNAP